MMNEKIIPIGYEDLKEFIDRNLYYIDKTAMLRDFLDNHSKVTLFTRPRRFGKTLNQSMFRRFFEDERTADGTPVDNRYLFDDLAISSCGEKYLRHQQQYPVINLSLKSGKQPSYEMAYQSLLDEIIREFQRHSYILNGEMASRDRKIFVDILNEKAQDIQYAKALGLLSVCLEKYHGRKCIILIDEYDVPLENAWFRGFYDKMIGFIRSLFESALKTNDSLEFGMITGCLRISRESIFTGLNNLEINSVTGPEYGDAFGFTEAEIRKMLSYYKLEDKFSELKDWYDGYLFGKNEIYNPWSIINYVKIAVADPAAFPKAYWSNTSSNSIVREIIENADQEMRDEVEQLMTGGTLEKPIHEEITYADIHESSDNLWNFLYFTGYLTSAGQRYDGEKTYAKMVIPNTEIRTIYRDTILRWFDKSLEQKDLRPLIKAIEEGNCDEIGDIISDELMDTISFFDYGENYYQGFLTGLLKAGGGYLVQSNRESGYGRPDLVMKTRRIRNGKAVILELKVAGSFEAMEEKCMEALAQIEEKKYAESLQREGYRDILRYGICFFKKECMVLKGD